MYYITEDKERWTGHKKQSRVVAARMYAVAQMLMLHAGEKMSELMTKAHKWEQRAARVGACANRLFFRACPECNIRYITRVELCHDRLCPVCSWRRALALSARLKKIVSYNKGRYILLTLTIKNCAWTDLGAALKKMLYAWQKMSRRTRFKRAFSGWVRTTEITRGKDGNAHPHLHILLETRSEYFTKNSGLWIDHEEFVEMWRKCLSVSYAPAVDVRAVKDDALSGAVAEVTKYIAKSSQISGLSDADFYAYGEAVAGVRMWAAGGTMRAANADITAEELLRAEGGEDRGEDKHICPKCGRVMEVMDEEWSNIDRCYKAVGPPGGMTIINYGVINFYGQATATTTSTGNEGTSI